MVEAGLYLTAGTKVRLLSAPQGSELEASKENPKLVKASELSGASGLLFRRNSTTGAVEALARSGGFTFALNSALHAND